ncbi:MAG: pitrilysin family protein, partial [Bacilli bacterium]
MEKHVLSNGLKVVIERIPSVRSIAIGIWVGTGSRDETALNTGVSHFIEHMLFKGTDKYNAREIAEAFDSIGGQVNAFTSKEYTCYYARVLDQHFPVATKMLAELFFRSSLKEEELIKERNVVIEEIRMYEDTPDDLVHDLLSHATYGESPLGSSILGKEDVLGTFTRQHLIDYMSENYTVENTVIAIAGNVDS